VADPTPAPVATPVAVAPLPLVYDNNYFYIKNVDSGLVIDVSEPVDTGVHAALTVEAGLSTQIFKFLSPTNYREIMNTFSSYVLDTYS